MGQVWKKLVGYGEESSWGAAVPVTDWLTAHGDPTLTVGPTYEPSQETRQTRQAHTHKRMGWEATGEIPDIEVRKGEFDKIWKLALGESPSAGVYDIKDGPLPSFTIEENKNGKTGWRWKGAKVQSLNLTAAPGAILLASLSIVAKTGIEIGLASLATPTFSDIMPFVFHEGTFKIDSVEDCIFSFDLTIENNLKYPRFCSGTKYSLEPTEGLAVVTGSFTIDHVGTSNWDKIQNATRAALEYTFFDGTNTLKIELPSVVFSEPLGWNSDDQELMEEVSFMAENDNTQDLIKVTVS